MLPRCRESASIVQLFSRPAFHEPTGGDLGPRQHSCRGVVGCRHGYRRPMGDGHSISCLVGGQGVHSKLHISSILQRRTAHVRGQRGLHCRIWTAELTSADNLVPMAVQICSQLPPPVCQGSASCREAIEILDMMRAVCSAHTHSRHMLVCRAADRMQPAHPCTLQFVHTNHASCARVLRVAWQNNREPAGLLVMIQKPN